MVRQRLTLACISPVLMQAYRAGALAVWGLLRLVKTRSFTPFVIYRVVAGLAIIAIAAAR